MDDLSFLDEVLTSDYGASNATLKAVLPGSKVVHISDNITPFKFLDACPLLYHSFEYNSQSRLQASIEASSETAVISLARYCYTGSYLAAEPDGESIVLLQHAETYKIAEDYDVPELQIMAHGNFSCQIEYACCLPKPPNDLLDTIRFVYRHFASEEARRKHNLVDTLLNYCVAVYLYHKLGVTLDFLTAVHEIPAFRQDLCRTNIARNFEDECAAEIIRLPSGSTTESSRAPTTLSSRNLPNEMLFDLPRDTASFDLPSAMREFAVEAPAKESNKPITLSFRRRELGAKPGYHEIPHPSKHSVSPSALTAALEKCNESKFPDIASEITTEDALRKYKRARIDETMARFPDRSALPGAGPSNEHRGKEKRPSSIELATTSDEESYWDGAFGQTEMSSSKIVTEGTSQSARRLLFEYGRRNARHVRHATSSPTRIDTSVPTALLLRPHDSEIMATVSTADDTASEDEEFAMVKRAQATTDAAQHSPMSSPELVPTASIAQTMADDKTASDDDWTML